MAEEPESQRIQTELTAWHLTVDTTPDAGPSAWLRQATLRVEGTVTCPCCAARVPFTAEVTTDA